MRKFLVRANFRMPSIHRMGNAQKDHGNSAVLERKFEIFADDVDDSKVRAKQLLKGEGYDEKSLQHATWTVSRLDRPRGKKQNKRQR